MSDLRNAVALAVRAKRRERGMSQEQLAGEVGVTVESISNIERGVSTPSLDLFTALARALELNVLALLDAEPTSSKTSARRIAIQADTLAFLSTLNDEEAERWLRVGRAIEGR